MEIRIKEAFVDLWRSLLNLKEFTKVIVKNLRVRAQNKKDLKILEK